MVLTLGLFSLLCLWRLSHFDAIFPQPVLAKVGQDPLGRIFDGYRYLLSSADQYPVMWMSLIAIFAYELRIKQRRITQGEFYIFALLIACLGFVVATGGNWMEGGQIAGAGDPAGGHPNGRFLHEYRASPSVSGLDRRASSPVYRNFHGIIFDQRTAVSSLPLPELYGHQGILLLRG